MRRIQCSGVLCAARLQEPPLLPGLLLQQLQAIASSSRVAASLNILHWLQLVAGACRAVNSATAADAATAAAAAADAAADVESTFALAAAISAVVPEQLPDSCLAYLSAPGPSMPSYPAAEPYAELAPLYAKMRRELYALVNACLQVRCVLGGCGVSVAESGCICSKGPLHFWWPQCVQCKCMDGVVSATAV
jgi:hypothetical protein